MFEGSIVALVTPFKNGKVDEEKLRELVEFHIKNGTSGIVPCGTTGESATLTHEEHNRVIEVVIEAAKKRIKIIAGTGSNSTAEAIDLTRYAEKAGADAALLLSPYYNKPTQRGLYMHYKAIADSVKIPVIPYNIQSRTAVNIEPETFQKLAQIKNIVGVKESSGNLEQISRIRMLCGPNFEIISGDDALTLPIMAVGGVGVISVVANIVPRDVADLVAAFRSGDVKKAQELHYKLLPLVRAMFIETNPIPVKTAMELVGMLEPELRLPLCHMSEENLAKLAEAVKKYGL
ncbi:MAG TPA: 4-hydroxy-tetrahydrodipicolinate synthase [Candidatus Omnitrophota bacterium]|nr:4-hydroxy-tetrahydrodipicolinate synthase [Candidatus Omnitrophota bacterium]HOX09767.1 4-hydroxy-tetrahydrodipicolinate synthase [Candidatus Omnitrophota bacterium]HRZ66590.1 4-hydroxy-tetrahydrodipicolinate synthase [Candidatus Omnitrophota bacterium]